MKYNPAHIPLFLLSLSLSTPFFLSLCTKLLSRNFPLFSSASFFSLAIAGGAERPRPSPGVSSYSALKPQYLICVSPFFGAFPGATSKIAYSGGHLGHVMNSPHNCLCHHIDFSIDIASLLFRVLRLNSTFPNKYSLPIQSRARSARKTPPITLELMFIIRFPMAHVHLYIYSCLAFMDAGMQS